MRLTVPIFVFSAVGGVVAGSEHAISSCLRDLHQQLADQATCGDNGSINYCLGLNPHAWQIPSCFFRAGCSTEECVTETDRLLEICVNRDGVEELKRREEEVKRLAGRADATTTRGKKPDPTTTPDEGGPSFTSDLLSLDNPESSTPLDTASPTPTQTSPHETTAHTTTDTPTTTAPSSTDTAASMPTSTSTGSDAVVTVTQTTSASAFTGTATTSLACLVGSSLDVTVCPTQSTGAASGSRLSCYPTSVPTQVCGPGLFCMTDDKNNTTCMVRDTHISWAGIAIAIVFAVVLFGAIALMIFSSCREKAALRKHERQEEALLIAKAAKAQAGKRPSVGVRSVSAQSAVMDTGYAGGRAPSGGYADSAPLMYNAQGMGNQTVVQTVPQDPFADPQYHQR